MIQAYCTACGGDCSHASATYKGDIYHVGCIPTPPKRIPPLVLQPGKTVQECMLPEHREASRNFFANLEARAEASLPWNQPKEDKMADEKKLAPMRHCFNCGEELGRYRDYDPLDTCGKPECDREGRDAVAEKRSEAHRQLDEDNGWGSW